MKNRKTFLTAVATAGAGLALLATRDAGAQTAAPSVPGPAPSATASPAPPSAVALAIAATMREFDKSLTDEQITAIARDIDDNRKSGTRLNPRLKRLKNSDEPATVFAVRPYR